MLKKEKQRNTPIISVTILNKYSWYSYLCNCHYYRIIMLVILYLFSNDLFIDVIGKHRTWAKYWTIHWGHHSCRNCSKTLKITKGIHVKYCRLILQYRWYKKTILCKFYFIVVENCCKLSKLTLVSYKEHACNFQSKITVI